MKKFQTIGQEKKIARKSIRINTIKWLEAAAEDGFTKEKNFSKMVKSSVQPQLSVV